MSVGPHTTGRVTLTVDGRLLYSSADVTVTTWTGDGVSCWTFPRRRPWLDRRDIGRSRARRARATR